MDCWKCLTKIISKKLVNYSCVSKFIMVILEKPRFTNWKISMIPNEKDQDIGIFGDNNYVCCFQWRMKNQAGVLLFTITTVNQLPSISLHSVRVVTLCDVEWLLNRTSGFLIHHILCNKLYKFFLIFPILQKFTPFDPFWHMLIKTFLFGSYTYFINDLFLFRVSLSSVCVCH